MQSACEHLTRKGKHWGIGVVDSCLDYVRHRNEKRKEVWIANYILGHEVLTPECVTDDHAIQELYELYGTMNEDSQLYRNYVKNCKESMREEITRWCGEANKILSTMTVEEVNSLRDPNTSSEQRELFLETKNPFKREQWIFPVPQIRRREATLPAKENKVAKISGILYNQSGAENEYPIRDLQSSGKTYVRDKEIDSDNYILEFADQEMKLLMRIPDELHIPLRLTVVEMMKHNFFGITNKNFFLNFERSQGYLPSLKRLVLVNQRHFILTIDEAFCYWTPGTEVWSKRKFPTEYDPTSVLMPKYLYGRTCSQSCFLERIWHLSLVVLHLNNNFIPLNFMRPELYRVFGIQFNPKMFGFESVTNFFGYLNYIWPEERLEIVHVQLGLQKYPCLVRETLEDQKMRRRLERQAKHKLEQAQEIQKSIPEGFATKDDKILHFSSAIREGMTLRCYISCLYSTDLFFLELRAHGRLVLKLKDLLSDFDKSPLRKLAKADAELINPVGHFLLGFFDKQWHRVVTLARDSSNIGIFKVLFLDIGGCANLTIQSLRYLPTTFLNLPAIAIPCRFVLPEDEYYASLFQKPQLNGAMLNRFDDLTFKRTLEVEFVKWDPPALVTNGASEFIRHWNVSFKSLIKVKDYERIWEENFRSNHDIMFSMCRIYGESGLPDKWRELESEELEDEIARSTSNRKKLEFKQRLFLPPVVDGKVYFDRLYTPTPTLGPDVPLDDEIPENNENDNVESKKTPSGDPSKKIKAEGPEKKKKKTT